LLATSLSEQVKSVEEIGVKGELDVVPETFEPERFRSFTENYFSLKA
jgi:hypothetical protein